MTATITTSEQPVVTYPDSDGQPMAENTLQFEYIVTIKGGLDALFRDDRTVFVAGDLLWYPVEGDNTIRTAPDALVAFGRPKGYRGSYRQWEEGGIAPHVVFEVLSPGSRAGEMQAKFRFYEHYAVDEYYVYDPDHGTMAGWLRDGAILRAIPSMAGWVSRRLGVRFELAGTDLCLYGPDGRRFATYVELAQQRDAAQRDKEQAQRDKEQAQRDKEQAQRDKEQAQARVERLAAQLRALGMEPDA